MAVARHDAAFLQKLAAANGALQAQGLRPLPALPPCQLAKAELIKRCQDAASQGDKVCAAFLELAYKARWASRPEQDVEMAAAPPVAPAARDPEASPAKKKKKTGPKKKDYAKGNMSILAFIGNKQK